MHLKALTPRLQSPCISSPWLLIHFVRIGHVAHVNGSCCTYNWVTPHIWMGHVAHINVHMNSLSFFLHMRIYLSRLFPSYAHLHVRRDPVICVTRSTWIFATSLINMHCATHGLATVFKIGSGSRITNWVMHWYKDCVLSCMAWPWYLAANPPRLRR